MADSCLLSIIAEQLLLAALAAEGNEDSARCEFGFVPRDLHSFRESGGIGRRAGLRNGQGGLKLAPSADFQGLNTGHNWVV